MTPEEVAALDRAIANLFDRWRVDAEIGARILAMKPELYAAWKSGCLAEMDDDLKLRLILLLNIHVQLAAVIGKGKRGYEWMNKANDVFGQSPLNMLGSGDLDALLRLQSYLSACAQYP